MTSSEPAGLDLAALTRFLGAVAPGLVGGPLRADLISGGKSNLTYRVTDGERRWVLRRPPLGMVLATAHDMSREYRVMAGLAGSAVPVPGMVADCSDTGVIGAPFYVMDSVDGVVYRSPELVAALTPEQCRSLGDALVDTLADLHDVDPYAVGLGELGRPVGYLSRQLRRWVTQFETAKVREQPAILALGDLLTRSCPVSDAVGAGRIVHGDYRIDNVMVSHDDPGTIAAVLDWEMATLGDPLADLGILVSFWDEPGRPPNPVTGGLTAFAGFPGVDDVVARYAERRRIDVSDVDWYVVFGLWKVAIILEQIHARHEQGQTLGDGFDDVGTMVAPLLDRAQEVAAASRSRALRTA